MKPSTSYSAPPRTERRRRYDQGMLELLNIPYVGNGVLASSAGMDKVVMKHLFAQAGLAQAKYALSLRKIGLVLRKKAQAGRRGIRLPLLRKTGKSWIKCRNQQMPKP